MVKNNLLRVTQINAVYFDKQVFNVLQTHIQECLKYLPPGFTAKFEHEIFFLLRLGILNYSVLKHDATFGQRLLSIKYNNVTRGQKLMIILSECFDYVKNRLEVSYPSYFLNRWFYNVHIASQFLRFYNISSFLRSGKNPQLIERVLGLEQVYSRDDVHRHYEDKYMTRELIWNGFIEVLVYLLPLINYHKISRTVRHLNPLYKKPERVGAGRKLTVETRCSHCGEPPIHPHHMGCSHIFCYYCLRGNQAADNKFECPICEYSCDNVICEKVY